MNIVLVLIVHLFTLKMEILVFGFIVLTVTKELKIVLNILSQLHMMIFSKHPFEGSAGKYLLLSK